jgi:LPXTG-site transpeptidase (sortase) family protein
VLSLCACGPVSSSTYKAEPQPSPSPAGGVPSPASQLSGVATPAHLIISAIGVNASVEPVGIQANGDLATPTQNPWENVGWYSAGPRPGEDGSSVIDGHVDRPGGSAAVFWRLDELRVGDTVVIVDSTGITRQFNVTRLAYYHPQDAPLQEIFGTSGGTYLNLITCAGEWIPSQHQTTLRLVVYTTLETAR